MSENQSEQPTLAVVDYGMGNLRSVAKALEAVGADVRVVTQPEELRGAAGLVLPGVGALGDCISALRESGFDQKIREWIAADRPFLGICLGMQALFESSEEGAAEGLGIFPGTVRRFQLSPEYKVPHMGWNSVRFTQASSPLLAGLETEGEAFYFVHSYYCAPSDRDLVLAECDYGGRFTAAIAKGQCYATQFHPEKSQTRGLQLYRNFVKLCGRG